MASGTDAAASETAAKSTPSVARSHTGQRVRRPYCSALDCMLPGFRPTRSEGRLVWVPGRWRWVSDPGAPGPAALTMVGLRAGRGDVATPMGQHCGCEQGQRELEAVRRLGQRDGLQPVDAAGWRDERSSQGHPAARAAATISSLFASGRPIAMLSRIVALKTNGSCDTIPMRDRSDRRS